jgi:hypothetical protein
MTRTTRILATAATLALFAGVALAQGPRFGGAAPGYADAQPDQVRQRIYTPDIATPPARPARPAQSVAAPRGLQVADGTVGPMHDQIAEALGITSDELLAMHADGLTLVEIADSLGVDLSDLPVGPAQAGGRMGPARAGGQYAAAAAPAYGPQSRMQRDAPRGRRW